MAFGHIQPCLGWPFCLSPVFTLARSARALTPVDPRRSEQTRRGFRRLSLLLSMGDAQADITSKARKQRQSVLNECIIRGIVECNKLGRDLAPKSDMSEVDGGAIF